MAAEPVGFVRQLWPVESGVSLTEGKRPFSVSHTAESYVLVPNSDRPRFLVPLLSRRAAWASVARYNALRRPRVRLLRGAIGAAMLTGIGQRALRSRLIVSLPDDARHAPRSEVLLSGYLADHLGVPELAMGIGVHEPDPNAKPTAQLFSRDGRALGFAKVGWNRATRHLIDNEARALRRFSAATIDGLQVPALLHAGTWYDRSIAVAAPLPARVRRHADPDRLPPLRLNVALSSLGGQRRMPLRCSPYWENVQRQVATVREDPAHRELSGALSSYAEALQQSAGEQPMTFGSWHGDWVPWNMAWQDGTLHVWDWEHSDDDVPVGFDIVHWLFQVALVLRHRPLREAVAAVDEGGPQRLADVGVPREAVRAVCSLYLLEMFLRTYRLMRDGSGWNPALYPAMLDVLHHRSA